MQSVNCLLIISLSYFTDIFSALVDLSLPAFLAAIVFCNQMIRIYVCLATLTEAKINAMQQLWNKRCQ